MWIVLIVAGNGWANSQPPPPTPTEAREQPKTNTKQDKHRAEPDKRGTESSPLVIKVLPSETNEPDTSEATSKQNDYASPEWALVYVTAILTMFTGGLMFYTAKLWGAAQRQAVEMQESLVVAERANLSIGKWNNFVIEPGKGPIINFQFINSGRSHAEIIEFLVGYKITTKDNVPPFARGEMKVALPALVPPNNVIDICLPLSEPLTEDQFRKIMARQNFIFLLGEVTYTDIFQWTCVHRFGAQIGYYGGGVVGAEFIAGPGYNSIKWSKPKEAN